MLVRKTEIHTVTHTIDYNVPDAIIIEQYGSLDQYKAALADGATSAQAQEFASDFFVGADKVWNKDGKGEFDVYWGYPVEDDL